MMGRKEGREVGYSNSLDTGITSERRKERRQERNAEVEGGSQIHIRGIKVRSTEGK